MEDFLMIGIVGVGLSLVVELIQSTYGTDSKTTKGLVIGLSIVLGGLYTILKDTIWWATILEILAGASTVYAMFFSGKSKAPSVA